MCDPVIERAVSTWNAQNSQFYFQFDRAASLTSTRGRLTDARIITVEDETPSEPGRPGRTFRYTSPGTTTIIEIDTIINSDYLWYNYDQSSGRFHCPYTRSSLPAGQYDYETTIAHELGHALGFDDTNNTACIMHYTQGTTSVRRTPCLTETNNMRTAYGSR